MTNFKRLNGIDKIAIAKLFLSFLSIVSFLLISPLAHAATEAAAEAGKEGVLDTLGVNWKMFVGQLINFSIVLFVLWKFVFGPVSKALAVRSEKIDAALKDAERIAAEKKEFDVWKEQETAKARKEASAIITLAQTEAAEVKRQTLAETKTEQDKMMTQTKTRIDEEEKKMISEVKGEIAGMVTIAAEKVLREKLDSKKDQELIKEALKSL